MRIHTEPDAIPAPNCASADIYLTGGRISAMGAGPTTGGGRILEYKKLVLVAPAWREELDPKTNTLYIRADFSSPGFCETIMTPVPGTDPVEYTYDCLPVTCEGECELRERGLPGGMTIYYCACPDGDGSVAVASAAMRGGAKAKGKVNKTASKKTSAKQLAKKPTNKSKKTKAKG